MAGLLLDYILIFYISSCQVIFHIFYLVTLKKKVCIMKVLSALLLTFIFILTGCGDSSSSSSNIGNVHVDTSKYLRVAKASANSVPVPVNKYILLVFSASIDESTVNVSSVYIADENSVPVPSALTVSKEKISIIPDEFFLPNKQYTVVVTTALEDIQGRSLENTFTYTFITASLPDNIPPSLISVTPADGVQVPVPI